MDEEDKGFYILVLGVLAAVLMTVIWFWLQRGDTANFTAAPAEETPEEVAAEPEPEPTPVPEPTEAPEPEPEPTAVPEPTEAPEPEPTAAPAAPAPDLPDTVVDVVGANGELRGLGQALGATGLDAALQAEGPFTVFGPSDRSLAELPELASARLFSERNAPDTLTYHVVPGTYTAADLVAAIDEAGGELRLDTVQGDAVTLTIVDGAVVIDGRAEVTTADQAADNGVVHTIDNVLVPREQALNLIVALEPIQFAVGSAVIEADSQATLDQVVAALEGNDIDVLVEGHTDNTGDPAANQALSEARAQAVVDYLVSNGIEASRLSAEGFGQDDPIADNSTDEGRAENRRIEFAIQN